MKQVIARFAGTGKYQLLEYVSPCVWKVLRTFDTDQEAMTYYNNHTTETEL